MARLTFINMTNREVSKLDRLTEPLTEAARGEVFDIIEDWHLREKSKAVEKVRNDLKYEIIFDIASNF